MAAIHTVTGEIRPQTLGVTYCHEHILFIPPEPYLSQEPDLAMDSLEVAIHELNFFAQAGGQALAEMSTADLKRDPAGMRTASEQTGVYIIAAAGYNKAKFSEPLTAGQTVEQLAGAMIQDLTTGMDGSEIKAGLIKAPAAWTR